MSAWLRRALAFACLVAVWVVASPAEAAAPVCERAASMLAPMPILDAPSASLDVGERPDACDEDALLDKAFHRGERSHRAPPIGHPDAVLPPAVTGPVLPSGDAGSRLAPDVADLSGVRVQLERPPRP